MRTLLTSALQWLFKTALGVWTRNTRALQLLALGAALATGGVLWVQHWYHQSIARAVAVAKQETRDSIGTAAAKIAAQAQVAVQQTSSATDSVRDAVDRRADRVRRAIARVPARVRDSMPEVAAVIAESNALLAALPPLSAAVITERHAHAELQLVTATLVVVMADSLHVEQARPKRTWKSTAVIATIGAITVPVARWSIRALTRGKS